MQLPGIIQFRKCSLTDEQLAEAAAAWLARIYTPPIQVPTRHIPARPDEDFDLIIGELIYRFHSRTPNSFLLRFDAERLQDVSAVATKYNEGQKPVSWAIRRGGSVMSKRDGGFYYEPNPSSRDESFFEEFRFDSFIEAEKCYRSFYPE